ncbi:MAG: PQQ-binding-like beta-propeller repeat protein [Chthoniobacteraceae bacterium]
MPIRFPLVCLSMVALGLMVGHAADHIWPQFRGPTGQGLSDAKNVPTEWSAEKNVAWKVEVPGSGWSSPVLAHDRIYLTSAMGEEGRETLHTLCLSTKDGRLVWDTNTIQPGPGEAAKMHRKNSSASATPIVTDDRIYVHFGHMGTAALDLDGKILWTQTELKYSPVHGTGASPALVDGLLIFSCDGAENSFVAALDAATGAVKWKTPRNSPAKKQFSFSTPLVIEVDGVKQAVLPGSGFVAAYAPQDGAELWKVRYGEGYSVVPRPVYAHGLLFVSSGFDQAVLYAIDPKGAKGDVTDTNVKWTYKKGVPKSPSMIAVGEELYFVADNGIATCADARTGKVHWTERLGGDFSASPIAAEGRLYFLNETGVGYIVKAAKKYQLIATNDLDEATLASPAVTDGTLYLRSESHLWKIGK